MPILLRFLLVHAAVGIGAGWVVLAGFIATNVFGLRALIFTSPDGGVALALLLLFFALTFGSAGMGIGIMADTIEKSDSHGARSEGDDRPLS